MFGDMRVRRRIAKVTANNLPKLDLSGLGLTALPEEIGNLTNLTTLYLYSNRLEVLPEWIGNLTNLTKLSLFGNRLEVLPGGDW